MNDNPFTGVWIPASLWHLVTSKTINSTELVLYLVLRVHTPEGKESSHSNGALGLLLNVSTRTITKHLSGLEKAGLIQVTNERTDMGIQRWIRLIHPDELMGRGESL